MAYVLDLREYVQKPPVKRTIGAMGILSVGLALLLGSGVIAVPWSDVLANTTSATYAGSAAQTTGGSCTWGSPSNATGDTTSTAATCAMSSGDSNLLRLTGFGFTATEIPTGSSIDGVTLEVEWQGSGTRMLDSGVQLTTNGTSAVGGSDNKATNAAQTTKQFQTYGGSTDDWTASLTQAQVTTSNFGVLLQYHKNNGQGSQTASVFRVRITIDFTPPQPTFAGADYRWYEAADSTTPGPALAAQNATSTLVATTSPIRLRTNITVGAAVLSASSGQLFKLQFQAGGTGGAWTDVGAGQAWEFYNASPSDGASISTLLTTSDVAETYEENNPTVDNPNQILIGEQGEWDFSVVGTNAINGTDYYFRLVESDNTVLASYDRYPGISVNIPTLSVADYRWYQNIDAIDPSTPLAAENASTTLTATSSPVRLRANVSVATWPLATSTKQFKLQFRANDTVGAWTDVGAGQVWQFYDNPGGTVVDGATTTGSFLVSSSEVHESYEENNPTKANVNAVPAGEDGEYDFALIGALAANLTDYYFRIVESDGTVLATYPRFPGIEIDVPPPVFTGSEFQWFANADNVQPGSSLDSQNASTTLLATSSAIRLRTSVAVSNGLLATSTQLFKLQFIADDTGGSWTDVGPGQDWEFATNGTPSDGDVITSVLLSGSEVKETYEENNPTFANPNNIAVGQAGEWDFVLKGTLADNSTDYYFRMVENDNTPFSDYIRFPGVVVDVPATPSTLVGEDYRWYVNADNADPSTPIDNQNASSTLTTLANPIRLRINLSVADADLDPGAQFKLQFQTDGTGGAWTDVGAGQTWQFHDNGTPDDGDPITTLLSTSDIAETYEEDNPTVASPNTVAVGEYGEWDFALDPSGVSDQTEYYFRMVRSTGAVFSDYARFPGVTIDLPQPVLTQDEFRWYYNKDALQPDSAFASLNATATDLQIGSTTRLRMNIAVSNATLSAGAKTFALQFAPLGGAGACQAVSSATFVPVGDVGSTTALWRGIDNSAVSDGATISTPLISDVGETYEESNPTASMPNDVSAGQTGEWDFVIQNHAAAAATTYCFRMVEEDGTPLDSYALLPAAVTLGSATWRQPENTPDSVAKNESLRLRLQIDNDGNVSTSSPLRLEYASTTAGPWIELPVDASCTTADAAFRVCPSIYFSDQEATTNRLTGPGGSSFVSGYMLETSNPAPSSALDPDEFTELEWNIQATDSAIDSSTYYFRAAEGGAAAGTYAQYPELFVQASNPIYTQEAFWFYVNEDALVPSDPWPVGGTNLGESAGITVSDVPLGIGDVARVRMSLSNTGLTESAGGVAFTLEYGERITTCGAITDWFPFGDAASSTAAWRGNTGNSSIDDGDDLDVDPPSTLILTDSTVAGTYEEENDSATNPFDIIGDPDTPDYVEYDWVVENYLATGGSTYCFRMVEQGGTPLNAYTEYPFTATGQYDIVAQHWAWYDDEGSITPSTPLEGAGQDVSPTDVAQDNTIKLRYTVRETSGGTQDNARFKLMFSEEADFSDGGYDVASSTWCTALSLWCYDDGAGVDQATLADTTLSDASPCGSGGCGTHNESTSTPSTYTHEALAATEFEFTIRHAGARANTTYFFRLYDTVNDAVVTSTSSYPSLSTEGAGLSFILSGLPALTSTEGTTTDVGSSPTGVAFGSLPVGDEIKAAQRLTVTTNATEGYHVFAYERQNLIREGGETIDAISATNDTPTDWDSACNPTASGCWGYHAGDDTLATGNQTRFLLSNTFAAFDSTPREVAYNSNPVQDEVTDMVYKIRVNEDQEAGTYESPLVYIISASF